MEAISDTWDFSKPTGRTQDHDSAKLTITSRMPQLKLALSHFLLPSRQSVRSHKSQRPRNPAKDEFHEGGELEHAFDYMYERSPVRFCETLGVHALMKLWANNAACFMLLCDQARAPCSATRSAMSYCAIGLPG